MTYRASEDDNMTLAGALRHAEMIREYWRKQGREVNVTVECETVKAGRGSHNTFEIFQVRSNLGLTLARAR